MSSVHKSNCMLIGGRQRVSGKPLNVSIGGNSLTQVNSVWYLGVLPTVVLELMHSQHGSRIRSRLVLIAHYGSLPPAVLCVLYSAIVMPLC